MKTTGYHGTNEDNVEEIRNNGYNICTKNGWVGKGVYFFGDYYTMSYGYSEAKSWVINVRKFSNWSVFRAIIESEKYLDLVENSDHKKLFREIQEELVKKHINSGKNMSDFNEITIFKKFDDDKKEWDFIRVPIDSAKKKYYNYVVQRPQVQICVKNIDAIKENHLCSSGLSDGYGNEIS